jgi:hypothetical protein
VAASVIIERWKGKEEEQRMGKRREEKRREEKRREEKRREEREREREREEIWEGTLQTLQVQR